MKREQTELLKLFENKIGTIERLIKEALSEDSNSTIRKENAILVSVLLRSICCDVSETKSLVERCGFKNKLIFDYRGGMFAANMLTSFELTDYSISSRVGTFSVTDKLWNYLGIWGFRLTFDTWMNHAIIDFKSSSLPFLLVSPAMVIRAIADKEGAHIDDKIDGIVEQVLSCKIINFSFIVNNEEVVFDVRNLFIETILGLGMQLVHSYKRYKEEKIIIYGRSKEDVYIYEYDYNNKKTYLLNMSNVPGNIFYLDCYDKNKIYRSKVSTYKVTFRGRFFIVGLIDINKIDFSISKWKFDEKELLEVIKNTR